MIADEVKKLATLGVWAFPRKSNSRRPNVSCSPVTEYEGSVLRSRSLQLIGCA